MKIDLSIVLDNDRRAKWKILNDLGIAKVWLPYMTDLILNAKLSGSIWKHVYSTSFLNSLTRRLVKYAQFYSARGIDIRTLNVESIVTMNWMDSFADRMVCRLDDLKKGVGLPHHPDLRTEEGRKELRGIFLEYIYRYLPKYAPERGGLERFLFAFAFPAARNQLKKDLDYSFKRISLDAPDQSHLLEAVSEASEIVIEESEEEIDVIEDARIFTALRTVLDTSDKWELFHEAVYQKRSFDEIGRQRNLSKGRISQLLNEMREQLIVALRKLGLFFEGRKVQFKKFAGNFSEHISEELFTAKVPHPKSAKLLQTALLVEHDPVNCHPATPYL